MRTPLPTPPVREDGLCIVCLKPRHPELSQRYAPGVADLDPFCATARARSYYGTSLPSLVTGPRAKPVGRPRQIPGPLKHGTEYGYVGHGCRCESCRTAANRKRTERRRRQDAA